MINQCNSFIICVKIGTMIWIWPSQTHRFPTAKIEEYWQDWRVNSQQVRVAKNVTETIRSRFGRTWSEKDQIRWLTPFSTSNLICVPRSKVFFLCWSWNTFYICSKSNILCSKMQKKMKDEIWSFKFSLGITHSARFSLDQNIFPTKSPGEIPSSADHQGSGPSGPVRWTAAASFFEC